MVWEAGLLSFRRKSKGRVVNPVEPGGVGVGIMGLGRRAGRRMGLLATNSGFFSFIWECPDIFSIPDNRILGIGYMIRCWQFSQPLPSGLHGY